MPPITVDPDVLAGAGESVGSVGDRLATAIGTLRSSLAGGARSGIDPAGLAFGQSYQQTAQALLDAGAAAANAARSVGFGVQMSATNYSRADASSTIGGGTSPLNPPDAPTAFTGPSAPSSLGGGVPPPFLWSVIQAFIPDVWPDGSPGQLRATASAWQQFSSTMTDIAGQLTGPSGVIAGQQIPEGGAMATAISELSQSLSGIAGEAGKLATQTSEFADDVENTQNAIRDLLDRVSPSAVWDGIQSIFDGDALEELKEVANDVKTVLGEYARQAEGRRDVLQVVMGMLDDAIVSVENWARREFPKYLGDDVGNALATGLDFQLPLGEGVLAGAVDTMNSIGQLDPMRFAYDAEGAKATWAAMGESLGETAQYATPTGIIANPIGAFNHYKDQVTDAVHAEDWSSDRPGYGLGKIVFDVGAALIPGGAAMRSTKLAEDAVDAATPSPGRIADLPGRVDDFAPIASKADDITAKLDELGTFDDNLQTSATPIPAGPAIPRDLVEPPQAPRVSDSPDARVPDGPAPNAPGASAPHLPESAPADRSSEPHSPAPTTTPAHANSDVNEGVPPSGAPPIGGESNTGQPGSLNTPSPNAAPTNSLGDTPATDNVPSTHNSAVDTPSHPAPDESPAPRTDAHGSEPRYGDPPDGEPTDRSTGSTTDDGVDRAIVTDGEGDARLAESDDGTNNLAESTDTSRTYSLMDGSSHTTSFAPEQILDADRVAEALAYHGVSKHDFVELINKPTESLTPDERQLINAVRDDIPAPTRDTVMQKVIPPGYFDNEGNFVRGRADDYISADGTLIADRVGGAVTVASDTAHLSTPQQIYDGLRLDYSDTPFERYDQGTHIIRFQADPGSSSTYDVPRNSAMGGSGAYDNWDDPFTGTGFTKSADDVIPEFIAPNIRIREGAEMWEVLEDGTQRLAAVFKGREWIPQGT